MLLEPLWAPAGNPIWHLKKGDITPGDAESELKESAADRRA